jgi:hypothetical protein
MSEYIFSKRVKNIEGLYFGRWKVLFFYKTTKLGAYWFCECACGRFKVIKACSLQTGSSKSCGCTRQGYGIHYLCGTRIYKIHKHILGRCYNNNSDVYMHYGGRGITVCDEWKSNFLAFYEWSISNGYTDKLSIDRIDNNGPYSPENCRWTTQKEQCNNCRKNHFLTLYGKSMTISQWAEKTGINKRTLLSRKRAGWSDEKTLLTPVKTEKLIMFNGESKTMSQWGRDLGINVATIFSRIKIRGWSVEKALSTPIKESIPCLREA